MWTMSKNAANSDLDLSDFPRAGKTEQILTKRVMDGGFQVIRDTLQLLQDLRRNTGLDDGQAKALSDWLDRNRAQLKVLDLYSGSRAVGTACLEMGFRALTIDVPGKWK